MWMWGVAMEPASLLVLPMWRGPPPPALPPSLWQAPRPPAVTSSSQGPPRQYGDPLRHTQQGSEHLLEGGRAQG